MDGKSVQLETLDNDVSNCEMKNPCFRYEKFADTIITVFINDRNVQSVAQELVEFRSDQGIDEPFFVMDIDRVRSLVQNWFSVLPRVRPFFSLSCNQNPVLLRLLADYPQFGFYCQNRFELEKSIELVGESRIMYGNPLWTRRNISIARDSNVDFVICESESELLSFQKNHPDAKILLRVCMNETLADNAYNVGCKLFEEAPRLLRLAREMDLKIIGISFTLGYGTRSASLMKFAIAQSRQLFNIGVEIGHDMYVLDIGNSFPGSCQDGGLSFDELARGINEALDTNFPECSHGDIQIVSEPGSYFAASAFSLITNVIEVHDVDFDFLNGKDGNMFGFAYRTNESFFRSFGFTPSSNKCVCHPLYNENDTVLTYATVVGNSVEDIGELDVLQPLTLMRKLQVGERLIWDNMGAYSIGSHEESTDSPMIFYYTSEKNWHRISHAAIEQSLMVNEFAKAADDYFHSMSDGDTLNTSEGDAESLISCLEFINDAVNAIAED